MVLFEINEPGESHAKEACTTGAVGIDLGTTNSLVAIVLGDDKPRALAVDEGSTLLPSVVHYAESGGPGSVVVGRAARRLAADFPRDTIVSVKRFMGRSSADPETRRLSPYQFAPGESGVVRFVAGGGRTVNPVEVSAEILRALRSRAEARTHPAPGARGHRRGESGQGRADEDRIHGGVGPEDQPRRSGTGHPAADREDRTRLAARAARRRRPRRQGPRPPGGPKRRRL